MTLFHSEYARGSERVPAPQWAGDVVAIRFEATVPATAGAGDIIELGVVPASARVLDAVLDVDALDTHENKTIALDVGIMSGDVGSDDGDRTCGAELFDGVTTAQAGGVVRPTTVNAFRTSASGADRSIGVKIATAAATGAAGTVGLTVFFAS